MPICIEKKLTLSGKVFLFECELLSLSNGFGVLKYVINREYDINGVKLRSGDITHALYWEDRPYTLYIWHLIGNRVIYYFNIADSISLKPGEFTWRDLVVDILIDADRTVRVLDENDLPADLSPDLSAFIQSAKAMVLKDHRKIIEEADAVVSNFAHRQNRV